MTDPRVAIVQCWLDAGGGPVPELLEILDAAMQSKEVVERVARAMYEDAPELRDVLEPDEGAFTWEQLYEADRDLWRRRSRAALSAAVGGTKP